MRCLGKSFLGHWVFGLANFKKTQGVQNCHQGVLLNNKLPKHLHAADLVVLSYMFSATMVLNSLMKTTYLIGNLAYTYILEVLMQQLAWQ